MNNDLQNLLRRLQALPSKSDGAENAITRLAAREAEYTTNPDDYEVNRSIGMFLAGHIDTLQYAEPFLIKAVNENRDDEHRADLLVTLAKALELVGDLEREHLVLEEACRYRPYLYKDLAHSALRLGDVEKASRLFNGIIDIHDEVARERAQELGTEITQVLWPARVICDRFGELARMIDIYIKARKLGITPEVKAILPTRPEWISNRALLDYWRDQHADMLTILTDPDEVAAAEEAYGDCELLAEVYRLPDGRGLHVQWAAPAIRNLWEKSGDGPLLKLRADHRELGRQWMHRHGAPEEAWFVALHFRESGYHEGGGWSYNRLRDSRTGDYLDGIKAITDQGGWVVRLGDPSMTPLAPMENVIDYAVAEDRSDELDVFFCADARFVMAVASGPLSVAATFGTPVLGVNMFPPGAYPYAQ